MRITRRQFVVNSALCAGSFKLMPLLGSGQLHAQTMGTGTAGSLEHLFASPASEAWPWTYWYGMNGNITREGITEDLESMHRVGIRGVLYMEVGLSFPEGPVRSLTPEWRELMQHAMREADRLGIAWNMNNDGGWCGSGGPWITPELSMQMVVWSETTVEGPANTRLSQPKATHGYYKDIAVLAFPVPPGDSSRMVDASPVLTYGTDKKSFDYSKLLDGNTGTVTLLPLPAPGQPLVINIDFPEPFTAQAVSVALDAWNNGMHVPSGEVQISDDGKNYRILREMNVYWPNSSATFQKTSSRHYRIVIHIENASNWFWGPYKGGIPLGEIQLHEGPRMEEIPGKALYLRQGAYSAKHEMFSGEPVFAKDTVIQSGQILNISRHMDASGLLTWDPPPGKWTVLRLGHTSTGSNNEPAPKETTGLECDKLSKKAIEVQFNEYVGKLLQAESAVGAKAVKMAHIDSWEVGAQNWTPGFQEEFQARRGYDPVPYLPILTGRAIESGEHSERFLWDLRRTIADLLIENYAGRFREICHQHGLTVSIEAYGAGPLDELAYGGQADVPMGEFWLGDGAYSKTFNVCNKEMASSAHAYGRPIVGAEAFTSDAAFAKYSNHPFQLKPLGDLAFTWGINWFVLSQFMMQPWKDRKPGMTLAAWGSHLDRGNTWWEFSRPWMTYLARCQTLLQSGSFIADIAYLGSEGAPYSAPYPAGQDPALPAGYDYDSIPPQILLTESSVQEGRLTLKSGMSYRLLVLQPGRTMTPQLLRKIKDLVHDGATVVGPRPVASPSLSDAPQGDAEVERLAGELWGECDGSSIKVNRYGQGRVFWGSTLGDILAEPESPPDFDCLEAAVGEEIRFIHRNIDGDDFYFVASGLSEAKVFLCTFRAGGKGKNPELWWPDSGRIEPVTVFNESDIPVKTASAGTVHVGKVTIPIRLDPYGSVFVAFRSAAKPQRDHIVSVQHDDAAAYGLTPVLQYRFDTAKVVQAGGDGLVLETADAGRYDFTTAASQRLKAEVPRLPAPLSIQGPWRLEFPKNLGAPDHVTLDRLVSWTEHSTPGVKYFSGAATYRKRFPIPAGILGPDRRLYLDLGRVCVIAEIVYNGKNLGIFWKPPFMVDITDFATTGNNELEVRVVNLWPNRLVGDEHLPADVEWAPPLSARSPYPAALGQVIDKWPQWLLENKPRPSKRVAFPAWKYWSKDDPLLESGLLGPVRIFTKARVKLTS